MNHSTEYLHHVAFGIGVLGVLAIILGAIVAIRTVISYSLNSDLAHETPHTERGATP